LGIANLITRTLVVYRASLLPVSPADPVRKQLLYGARLLSFSTGSTSAALQLLQSS